MHGEDKFRELTGRGADALRTRMAGLAPDATEYVVEVVYGEMYQRAPSPAIRRALAAA